ncbi:response regulator [Citricoccus sp. SGAir0253]|uniref:response regulator transcription factor n=1 Tax=Citricoccus sp. SGAir0253 TaxID=2567881 RepID=UPI0010CCF884|nr:response regulator transcription factor [Citricoccus sp. SGAir0253]QCU77499.1 response regulator [Citricoccus sp. SGAir0253]
MPRRETALVIDDDEQMRSLLSEMLKEAGFNVLECSRGADAVQAVDNHGPLLVTLDIGLPDMDGFETLRRIRSRSSCYVMMISGRDDEMDLLSSLQLGADDFITKPFRARELRARLNAMLRRPRTAALPPALRTGRGGAPEPRGPVRSVSGNPGDVLGAGEPVTRPRTDGGAGSDARGAGGPARGNAGPHATGTVWPVGDLGRGGPALAGAERPESARPGSAPSRPAPPGNRHAADHHPSSHPGSVQRDAPPGAAPAPGSTGSTGVPGPAASTAGYRRVPPGPSEAVRRGVLSHLGLVLDPAGREVTADGVPVPLTRMEFDLLHELMRAGGAVRTKQDLVQALRGDEQSAGAPSDYVSTADEHALEVHMGNLRRKLGERRGSPRWVMTVRGVGYRLTPRPRGH